MIAEIATGLSSLKAALDLAKGLNAVATQAALNDVRIELQGHILAAQEALAAARDADAASAQRIRELEQEIVRLKDWEADKQRYELKAVSAGAFTYALKAGMENGEPAHWICTGCYQHGKKSILQKSPTSIAHQHLQKSVTYNCPACKATIAL